MPASYVAVSDFRNPATGAIVAAGAAVDTAQWSNRVIQAFARQGLITLRQASAQGAAVADPAAIAATSVAAPDVAAAPATYDAAHYGTVVTLVNEEKADINALRADVQALRSTVNSLTTSLRTAGLIA